MFRASKSWLTPQTRPFPVQALALSGTCVRRLGDPRKGPSAAVGIELLYPPNQSQSCIVVRTPDPST